VHECEFCRTQYLSRPQVKKPRACGKCQPLRQRENERDWHAKHGKFSDQYHRILRGERLKLIGRFVKDIIECLCVGQRLLGMVMDLEKFSQILTRFLSELGVRQINKFCDLENVGDLKSLSEVRN
jgi:hypothetical protein